MFWPSREKIPASPVEGCRCSDSYKTLLEEQVDTSLVRGTGLSRRNILIPTGTFYVEKFSQIAKKILHFAKKNLKSTKCI